ncbi:hypothetical protein ANN_25152 [Periplaneta americana]|uniref:Uncharacterized protein n=1 Tax=Periplaneta americana TaxID=6978 RepID=A0ABQ8S0T0_PERAM|nr:hypothetical protein ANN_25152 [Periplaneta americana]
MPNLESGQKGNIEGGEFDLVLWIEFGVAQWSECLVRSHVATFAAVQKLRVMFTRKPKVVRCMLLFVLRNPIAAKVATGG